MRLGMRSFIFLASLLGLANASASEAPAYDLKEDATHRYLARGSHLEVQDKRTQARVRIDVHAIALDLAYGRLYIAQGRHGLKALDLAEVKVYRPGHTLRAVERILNLDAFGIAIDARREIVFLSRFQGTQQTAATSGISVWHFPNPKGQREEIAPVVPLAFRPFPYAGALAYDEKTSRLYAAAGPLGLGALEVRQSGERVSLSPLGIAQVPGAPPRSPLGLSHDGATLFLGESLRVSTREHLRRLEQTRQAKFAELSRRLNQPGQRAWAALLKFGQGFFTFWPDADYAEYAYRGEAQRQLEDGGLSPEDYHRLFDGLRRIEGASRTTGSVAFVAVTSLAPILRGARAVGGAAAARAFLANPRAQIPVLVKAIGASTGGRLKDIALDLAVSDAVLVGIDVLFKRSREQMVRDVAWNTLYSTVLSFAGLSKGISPLKRALIFGAAAGAANHITVNITGKDSREWWRTQAFTVSYASVPILPWSSITRYVAKERVLSWFERSAGTKLDPIFAPALHALVRKHPIPFKATLFTSGQLIAITSYVKSDQIFRTMIWKDPRSPNGLRGSIHRERAPYRVIWRAGN